MNRLRSMRNLLFGVLLLAGCAAAPQTPTAAPAAVVEATPTRETLPAAPAATAVPAEAAAATPVPASAVEPASPSLPAWMTLPLVNARTGETFTLADFNGQTVFVEPMATWCTNCRQQLGNVRSAREQLGSDAVFIALSVETNITAATLAQYANDNGFDWVFAVMTPELLGEMVTAFGRTISNPPSTPHFIIRPDGTTTTLSTGIESAAQIVEQVQAAGGA